MVKETKNVFNNATLISSYESISSLGLCGREKIKKRAISLLYLHIYLAQNTKTFVGLTLKKERRRKEVAE